MKKYLYIASFFVLSIACTSEIYGQEQKIGYFDSDFILQNIPEYNGIEQQLKLIGDRWRTEIQELNDEIDGLEEDFEAKEILYTDEIRAQKLNEIALKKQEMNALIEQRFGANGDYFRQQQTLLEPIQRRIFQAVQQVAAQNGYDFVFDRSNDVRLVYARNEWNLNNDILVELGIDVEDESN